MTEKTPKNPRGPRPLKAGQKTNVVIKLNDGLVKREIDALATEEGISTRAGLTDYAAALLYDAINTIVRNHETHLALARADALEAEVEARRKALAEAEAELAKLKPEAPATKDTDSAGAAASLNAAPVFALKEKP